MNAVHTPLPKITDPQITDPQITSSLLDRPCISEAAVPASIVSLSRRASIVGILLLLTVTSNVFSSTVFASDAIASETSANPLDAVHPSADDGSLEELDVAALDVVIESADLGDLKNSAVAVLRTPEDTEQYTLVWTPFPDEGQGEPRASFSWRSTGEKTIYLTLVADDDSRVTTEIKVDLRSEETDQAAHSAPSMTNDHTDDVEELEAADSQGVDIVGGREAAVGAWPWQVALMADPSNGNTQFCGGALIVDDWVLTAAHCVDTWGPGTLYVVAGRHRLSSSDGEALPVSRIILHPSWNTSTNHADIALLKLGIASSATPVSIDAISYPPGTEATVIGWGLTVSGDNSSASDVLMQVVVPVSTSAQCTGAYGSYITDSMFCAGKAGSDSCNGDSGGPLMVAENGTDWHQIGIVSWGSVCGSAGYPGVYTEVSVFRDWVRKQVEAGSAQVTPVAYLPFISTGVLAHIKNGGFEEGPVHWDQYSTHGVPSILNSAYLPIDPHGENWSTWLGGLYGEVAFVRQTVTVPAGRPILNYWHWIASQDSCGFDYGGIGVNGEWYAVYGLCVANNTGRWVPASVDMSPFAGATINLDIVALTDWSLNSSLFIDDVSFGSTATSAAAPVTPSTSRNAFITKDRESTESANMPEKPDRSGVAPPAYQ